MHATLTQPQTKRWTREEYYRLAQDGWFEGQRVQLIEGEIIQMPPQGHPHALGYSLTTRWLESIFGSDFWVRPQLPLNVGQASDPEPDVAVVEGRPESYTDHPRTALLVVEVADTSLRLDRRKAGLYASAGVPDYWILDVDGRALEVYRNPFRDAAAEFGWTYAPCQRLNANTLISPLARPDARTEVAKLLGA